HESDSITARPPAPMTAGASKGLPRPAGTRPLGSRSELPLLDDDLHAGLRERLGAHLHPGLGERLLVRVLLLLHLLPGFREDLLALDQPVVVPLVLGRPLPDLLEVAD